MRLLVYVTSTDSINFPATISGATIKYLVTFGRRTSNIINIYKRTVALKYTTAIIRSILLRILTIILSLLSECGLR